MGNRRKDSIMKKYQMIALDMDGTLLDSRKKILPETLFAIEEAFHAGKTVVLCTGRGKAEIQAYKELFPFVRYAILMSGALIYDLHEKKPLFENAFSYEQAVRIVKTAEKYDGMIHYMTTDDSIVRTDQYQHMRDFNMETYQEMFSSVAHPVQDILAQMERTGLPEKMLIYCRSAADREAAYRDLSDLPLEYAFAETTSLEVSPTGVTKGSGLSRMATLLDIPIADVIAVGDAPNDTEMLKTAGLSVAMGNASEDIKEICDIETADNDHAGVGNVIRKYLLDDPLYGVIRKP